MFSVLARRRREQFCFVAHSKQNLHVFLNFLENILGWALFQISLNLKDFENILGWT